MSSNSSRSGDMNTPLKKCCDTDRPLKGNTLFSPWKHRQRDPMGPAWSDIYTDGRRRGVPEQPPVVDDYFPVDLVSPGAVKTETRA